MTTDPRYGQSEDSDMKNDNGLKAIQVFDCLEVGPVRLEKRRLIAPYRLIWNNTEETIDLIYRFEEDVFDPSDPGSQNLASMMAAQVALNYGLFCRVLRFRGVYDESDRNFLVEMAENTAREIYVKKFLEINPFLVGEAAHLPVLKLSRYLQAVMDFPEEVKTHIRWKLDVTDKNECAVLSSGGKDSLLTYGLMDEIGCNAHPVFVNESGRHWFTALNAYRYFKEKIPNTARVWVNSDRIFNWMLRRMSFIRKDFANIRSDDYPIRLWTVAVFLFGVLPVARKRHIKYILIGDEYDTTRRVSYQGIPHYDGLYDQSQYFDNALSRYYMRKGWSINQFSVLRPMGELLIEKILALRYPHLQKHQVSCHAAHKEENRIRPCGSCEKCRRIVGMLTALGADPTDCGYTKDQIERCLHSIATETSHQDTTDAEHLLFMLLEKDRIKIPDAGTVKAAQHEEVMKLRFDSERSPLNAIPVDLRKPLYKIMLTYAEGSMIREKRKWADFDPLNDERIKKPYPFEISITSTEREQMQASTPVPGSNLWGELTWPEAEDKFKEVDIALLPVGSIEQHGPHLPLDTDSFDAEYLARCIAEICSDPKPLVMPLISYGVSYEHDAFKGTISIANETLSRIVYEIGMSVAKNGIRKLVIINGHGGNTPALNYAAQMINRDARIFVCVDTGETSDIDVSRIVETPNDVHAGEIETSTSLAVRPHLVRLQKASRKIPRFSSRYLNFTAKRWVSWYAYTDRISKTGVIGDPTKASREKGEKIWQIMIAHLAALVEDLKNMTLDEIYQRRY